MTPEEVQRFLTAGTRTGKIAVVRKDGSPMVVPIDGNAELSDDPEVLRAWATRLGGR